MFHIKIAPCRCLQVKKHLAGVFSLSFVQTATKESETKVKLSLHIRKAPRK